MGFDFSNTLCCFEVADADFFQYFFLGDVIKKNEDTCLMCDTNDGYDKAAISNLLSFAETQRNYVNTSFLEDHNLTSLQLYLGPAITNIEA